MNAPATFYGIDCNSARATCNLEAYMCDVNDNVMTSCY